MDLTGTYTFAAAREAVWELLMDPGAIAACVPGCQSFEPTGADGYRATMTAKVGPVSGTFDGVVTLADMVRPESYRLMLEGTGRPGFLKGSATVRLTDEGARTRVDVEADAQVGGVIASVGQRLIGSVAKSMLDRFFTCMAARIRP